MNRESESVSCVRQLESIGSRCWCVVHALAHPRYYSINAMCVLQCSGATVQQVVAVSYVLAECFFFAHTTKL